MANQHFPDNGTGGEAGTHTGHADAVPVTGGGGYGLGMPSVDDPSQSAGNRASKRRLAEKDGSIGDAHSGAPGAPPGAPGVGAATPVNQ